jgi:diaminopimelate epimerase
MGEPGLKWDQVPVSKDIDTLHCKDACEGPGLTDCACCSMGNPHATFFHEDCESVPLDKIGHDLEHHAFFPERCNVSVVTVAKDKSKIRMRVWERGTGITQACGTGACGTGVNAIRRGYIGKEQNFTVEVQMDGGSLTIKYPPPGSGVDGEGHVFMTGGYDLAFTGMIPEKLWG